MIILLTSDHCLKHVEGRGGKGTEEELTKANQKTFTEEQTLRSVRPMALRSRGSSEPGLQLRNMGRSLGPAPGDSESVSLLGTCPESDNHPGWVHGDPVAHILSAPPSPYTPENPPGPQATRLLPAPRRVCLQSLFITFCFTVKILMTIPDIPF